MGRNAHILIAVLMLATLLVSSLVGPLAVLGVLIIFVISYVIIQSKKDYFEGMPAGKDRRFELKKGRSVLLKNYDMKVKFSALTAPRASVNEHTPRVIELTVEKNGKSRQLSFDANNMRATKIQEAFGVRFHLLDLRNNTAVLSVE